MDEKRAVVSCGTLLSELGGVPRRQLERLEALWITGAEELLSMSSAEADRHRLAIYVGFSPQDFDALLAEVQTQLEVRESGKDSLPTGHERSRGQGTEPDTTVTAQERTEGDDMPGTSLKRIQTKLTSEQLKKLRGLGVTSAEELLSMSALAKNRRRLASYLEMSGARFAAVLTKVKSQLDPKVVKEMMRPDAGGNRTGVLDSIPEGKRRGRRSRS